MEHEKEYVKLDVGNHLFTIHINNLRRFAGSFLDRLVAPEHDKRKSCCHYIKIQRDGRLFNHVTAYLENSQNITQTLKAMTRNDLKDLQIEADFYGLEGLIQLCDESLSTRFNGQSKRLEIIFGNDSMIRVLETIEQPTLILNIDRFVELSFFDSLDDIVTLCGLNKLPVYGFKSIEDDNGTSYQVNLSPIIQLFDQNLQVKHTLEVSRLTSNEIFLKKVLRLLIAIMSSAEE